MKLDIKKAYDMVDWHFLCKVLEAFGFDKRWIDWIFVCIYTPLYTVLINGEPESFFEASRGICQGKPPFSIPLYPHGGITGQVPIRCKDPRAPQGHSNH